MTAQQSGQALPLGIALLLAGTIMGVVLFNTGQVVNEKTRLANSADAAVYSGALWQARALNFNAYVNRAMVANQVAMAQAVSLQSWAQYARTATGNLSTVLAPVPVVGQIAAGTQRVMRAFEPIVEGFGNGMLASLIPSIRLCLWHRSRCTYRHLWPARILSARLRKQMIHALPGSRHSAWGIWLTTCAIGRISPTGTHHQTN